jgi:hypothetical protein
MTVIYQNSERKGSTSSPVQRQIAIGDAVGDATKWLTLGNSSVTFEIRGVTLNGTRTETTKTNGTRRVPHYRKDAGNFLSRVVVETKQSYEDDDQAGIIESVTGDDYIKKMASSEVGDLVRLRIAVKEDADEAVFMSIATRINADD